MTPRTAFVARASGFFLMTCCLVITLGNISGAVGAELRVWQYITFFGGILLFYSAR